MGDHGIGHRPPQVGLTEALQKVVADPSRGQQGELERGFVGDPRPVEVAGNLAHLFAKPFNLVRRPMNQNNPDP